MISLVTVYLHAAYNSTSYRSVKLTFVLIGPTRDVSKQIYCHLSR